MKFIIIKFICLKVPITDLIESRVFEFYLCNLWNCFFDTNYFITPTTLILFILVISFPLSFLLQKSNPYFYIAHYLYFQFVFLSNVSHEPDLISSIKLLNKFYLSLITSQRTKHKHFKDLLIPNSIFAKTLFERLILIFLKARFIKSPQLSRYLTIFNTALVLPNSK